MTKRGGKPHETAKVLSIFSLISITFYAIGAVLPVKMGLFAFYPHEYNPPYIVMFLLSLTAVASWWNAKRPTNLSSVGVVIVGAILGYVLSFTCLVVAFALFKRPEGIVASLHYFSGAMRGSPIDFVIGFFFAALATFSWLYGGIMFAVGHIFLGSARRGK